MAGIWASLPILLALTLFGVSTLILYLILLKVSRWWHGSQYQAEEDQQELVFPTDVFTILSIAVPVGASYLLYRVAGGSTNGDLKIVMLIVVAVICFHFLE